MLQVVVVAVVIMVVKQLEIMLLIAPKTQWHVVVAHIIIQVILHPSMFHQQQIADQGMDILNTILLLDAQQIVKTVQLLHHAVHATQAINYIQMHDIVHVPQEHTNRIVVIAQNAHLNVQHVQMRIHAVPAILGIICTTINVSALVL